jgi:hypothetical protein
LAAALFVLEARRAEAECYQAYGDYQSQGDVIFADVAIDYIDGGADSGCQFYEWSAYYGAWAQYWAQVVIDGPSDHDGYGYEPGMWSAYAWAEAERVPGSYTVQQDAGEYLCIPEDGCWASQPWSQTQFIFIADNSVAVTLQPSNYNPYVGESVIVWAELSGGGAPGYTGLSWGGCAPVSYLECAVNTNTAGPQTVAAYLDGQVGDQIVINVQNQPGGGDPPGGGGDPPEGSGYSSVSGAVFIDENGNGVFDEGDYPVAETTVYLTDQADTTVYATSVTSSAGTYQFDTLPGGGYRVKHAVPDGYEKTTDDSVPFNVPPNFAYNFGLQPQACTGGPNINKKGWRPNSEFFYRFGTGFSGAQSGEQADGLRFAAFNWSTRNQTTGLNTIFSETRVVDQGPDPDITAVRVPLPFPDGGGVGDLVRDGNGHLIGATIYFTTDINVLSAYIGYRKVALHELGHLHGFGDSFVPPSRRGATVMNQLNGRDDMGKAGDPFPHLPDQVTTCDAQKALDASNMP